MEQDDSRVRLDRFAEDGLGFIRPGQSVPPPPPPTDEPRSPDKDDDGPTAE